MTQKKRHANGWPGPHQMTRHHRIPRVRANVVNQKWNIVNVCRRDHEAWHHVFGERTPLEAVMFIVEKLAPPRYFSRVILVSRFDKKVPVTQRAQVNEYEVVQVREQYRLVVRGKKRWPFHRYELSPERQRSWNVLFGDRSYYSIVHEIILGRWSPPGYFTYVRIRAGHEGVMQLTCQKARLAA